MGLHALGTNLVQRIFLVKRGFPGQTFSSKGHIGTATILEGMSILCKKKQQQQNSSWYVLPFLIFSDNNSQILANGSKFGGPDSRARRATFGFRDLHCPLHYVMLKLCFFPKNSEVSLQYFDFNWNVVELKLKILKYSIGRVKIDLNWVI